MTARLPSVLLASALVALADFSGTRDVAVAVPGGEWSPTGPAEPSQVLALALTEHDTLRTIVGRIESRVRDSVPDRAAPGHGDSLPCMVAVRNVRDHGNQATPPPTRRPGRSYELVVVFGLAPRSGTITIEYAGDLYEPETAGQLAAHVLEALSALLADPDRPVMAAMRPTLPSALNLLTAAEEDPDPEQLPMLADSVRGWVAATPDAPAILTAEGAFVSYAELGALAGGLAGRLARQGTGGPVAVLVAESMTAAVAMLAVQCAQRCFVMLDSDAPAARNAALLTTAQCDVVVYDRASQDSAFSLSAATGAQALAYESPEPAGPVIHPGQQRRTADRSAAYIAFTSGTTGAPKGVVQPQRSFAQFIAWQKAEFGLGPGARVAMWSAPLYDACYMEVFGALATGAILCMPPAGERRNPATVAAWLESAGITFFQGVPSFIEYVVAALEAHPRPLPALANVVTAGEVLPPGLARRMRTVFSSARLHNMFGPTECVLASRHEIAASHPGNRRVPIGRPIIGRRLLVMDPQGRPVPRGAVGEIGIVSRFLATGYVGDESRTAGAFRPFPGRPDERIYHTGDFGRIGPDGELRYLGRRDSQVKVRGIRVNLDEIEAVLSRQPQVGRCKVVDTRVGAGHVQLVAFVRLSPARTDGLADCSLADPALAASWRQGVIEALGARAAPTRFIVVTEFPQTATGKPDLHRLRRLDETLRPPQESAAVTLRDQIRQAARTVLGGPVRDDQNLLAGAREPLLLALRLRRALVNSCPGIFDHLDVRAYPSIDALEDAATTGGVPPSAAPDINTE